MEVKSLKKENPNGESTDDEEIGVELDKLYETHKHEIASNRFRDDDDMVSNHDATLNFISRKNALAASGRGEKGKEAREDDPDYDFNEFEDAEVEEAEDRIYSEYKKRQGEGNVVDENVLAELAGNIPLEDMDQSIVVSARQGVF